MRNPLHILCAAALLLTGCVSTQFDVSHGASNEARYAAIYPNYAEFCAVSEMRKLPGSPVEIESGGPGGHSVLYLNGVCRVPGAGYPVIALCDGAPVPGQGVGISVNAHYRNANWTATEGRDFFFHGDLAPGEPLTRASYARTLARAEALGVLDGVRFHDAVMADKPPGLSDRDYMYELSVATDYGIGLGRDRYCARVPMDRARMAGVVGYLNSVNAPYRSGASVFEWNVLRDNCAHLTHNALATVGLWQHWPTDRSLLLAAFDFPVPKNEFVNLMRRTNDLPIDDPAAVYADPELRVALQTQDWLATRPGGLAEAEPVVAPNALFDTHLRLIFFDEAMFGSYRPHFDAIFAEARTTDLAANFASFAALYARILAAPPDPALQSTPERAAFAALYHDHIAREAVLLADRRAALSRLTGP